ncbi:hypothetical protein B296_00003215 [Ensete ventricosum]|uniref:Uncharacterized protein n=1 Tax=Ensete ventricosum TaxID=4639 RepID=A0A426YA75_ENSVE|nr:hypothetical protein B296_00003215 [Ensete ventricosum]
MNTTQHLERVPKEVPYKSITHQGKRVAGHGQAPYRGGQPRPGHPQGGGRLRPGPARKGGRRCPQGAADASGL